VTTSKRRRLFTGARFVMDEVVVDGPAGTAIRQVITHPGAVVVLPLIEVDERDAADPDVVIIHNYRAAIDAELLELVAGTLEPPEAPVDCAGRELREESGYVARELESLGTFLPLPGLSDECMHLFVARGLEYVGQSLDAGEQIRVERLPLSELERRAATGELRDGKTLAALYLYQLSLRGRSSRQE